MKEVTFSGIKPSGDLHLGNYMGAVRNWLTLQAENKGTNYFSIVDWHAITVPQEPADLRRRSMEIAKLFLSFGIDPEKSVVFLQSQVPEHTELAWLLTCFASMGELNKMTQFKEKTDKQEHVGAGLFMYPVLMAADVLLYDTTKVPVGEDQVQHVELARNLAERFNHRYNQEIFVVPNYVVNKIGTRLKSLQNPEKKMSKSDGGDKNLIYILKDSPESAYKKIKSAVTDSFAKVNYDEVNQPGISNLLEIYSVFENISVEKAEKKFQDATYGDFKHSVGESVAKFLTGVQTRYNQLSNEYVLGVMEEGAKKCRIAARAKLAKIYEIMGFIK
jgi:tryptophanyl-tRNA synthetase